MNFPLFSTVGSFLLNFRILSLWFPSIDRCLAAQTQRETLAHKHTYTQNGAFLWRAIEIFVDNQPGTICTKIYRDEIAFDIYLCFFPSFLSLIFYLIISQALTFCAHLLSLGTGPVRFGWIRASTFHRMARSFLFTEFSCIWHQKHPLEFRSNQY